MFERLKKIFGKKVYTVTFYDIRDHLIKTEQYNDGDLIVYPDAPTTKRDSKYRYLFTGWDSSVSICHENMTIRACYSKTPLKFEVKFIDFDNSVLSCIEYNYGSEIIPPTAPQREKDEVFSYSFKGWDKEFDKCTSNVEIKALYIPTYIDYEIVFEDFDGTIIDRKKYHYGDIIHDIEHPTRKDDDAGSYVFLRWNKKLGQCSGDETFKAVYRCKPLMIRATDCEPIKNAELSLENDIKEVTSVLQQKEEQHENLNGGLTIDEVKKIISENPEYILNNILKPTLFGNYKYSDISTFDKCRDGWCQFLDKIGFNYHNEEIIEQLLKMCSAYKMFSDLLRTNLEYYSLHVINVSRSNLTDMLKEIVDISIRENKALNMQFARVLFGRYYYAKYSTASLEKLYKNLIITVSKEEFGSWITNDEKTFDLLIERCAKRLKLCKCNIEDEYIFVKAVASSKTFIGYVHSNSRILESAKCSKYSSIIQELLNDGCYKENNEDASIVKNNSLSDKSNCKQYYYCLVVYVESEKYAYARQYYYVSDDSNIKEGDRAIVPVGIDNEEKEVIVKKVEIYKEFDSLPYPYENTKHIKRILKDNVHGKHEGKYDINNYFNNIETKFKKANEVKQDNKPIKVPTDKQKVENEFEKYLNRYSKGKKSEKSSIEKLFSDCETILKDIDDNNYIFDYSLVNSNNFDDELMLLKY